MSAPLRFLSLVVVGWVAVRATMLGTVSGFTVGYAKPMPPPPPVIPTEFPQLAAAEDPSAEGWPPLLESSSLQHSAPPPPPPVYYPAYRGYSAPANYAQAPLAPRPAWSLAAARADPPAWPASAERAVYPLLPPLPPLAFPPRQSRPAAPDSEAAGSARRDRWQLTSWALLRGAPSPNALASGGTLGGSQAGARVSYALNRSLALSLRVTSPIGGSSGVEAAAGVRWAPLRSLPLAITAERRQAISPHGGGRSDFALFVEGGLYRQSMPWRFQLDAYAQAGIVGLGERDMFADGALSFTRPVYRRFSAGFGVWGGFQPGVYRLDAGPRISMRVRDNISAHVDWRQRLVGSAQPASGPALTLAADF